MSLDREAILKNMTLNGVYFEVTTDDIERYSLGETIMVEVQLNNYKFELLKKAERLIGCGEIIRVDKLGVTNHGRKLGVTLKTRDKIDVYV